ncbi:MAG TPA: hypothetical protein VEX13_03300 [Chloroflexia bacterium]|nr:hypothetical protein [Chloroflexia bacterium]
MGVSAQAGTITVKRNQRARSVWVVLVLSTVAFFLLCGLGTVGLTGYLNSVTTSSRATLQLRHGPELTVLRDRILVPEAITGDALLNEGDEVRTGSDTEAFITLFDGNSTIQTYFDTRLLIDRLRTRRYFQNNKEARIVLYSGTAVFVTGAPAGYAATYRIATERAEINVEDSSKVRVRIEGPEQQRTTFVTLDYGSATVLLAGGEEIKLAPGTMARVPTNGQAEGPLAAEDELIHNGNFSEAPTRGADSIENGGLGTAAWMRLQDTASEAPVDPGTVALGTEQVGLASVNAAVMSRESNSERYARGGIRQEINRPVDFVNVLELETTLKIIRQSEPVGGPQGDLFPLTIRVIYLDSEQEQHEWKQSFYYATTAPDLQEPGKVPQGSWSTRKFTLKSSEIGRDIAVINSIEIYGYGKQFQSWITDISMKAR